MAASTRLRAAHRGAPLLLAAVPLPGLSSVVHAKAPAQRQELTAALRQLDAQERAVADSAAHTPIAPGERHRFDYPRLPADLARVRAGIQAHLTPSHAQPRDPANWPGTAAPSGPHPHLRRRRAGHEWRLGFRIPSQWRHCAFRDGDGARRRRLRRLLVWGVWAIRTTYVGVIRKPPQPAPVPRCRPVSGDAPHADFLPPLLT